MTLSISNKELKLADSLIIFGYKPCGSAAFILLEHNLPQFCY